MDALLLNKPLVVVGTPGRVSEFVRLGALKLHRCPLMVLDEVSRDKLNEVVGVIFCPCMQQALFPCINPNQTLDGPWCKYVSPSSAVF